MKRIIKRVIPLFMAMLLLTAALAGCRNDSGDGFELPEFVFLPEIVPVPLPEGTGWISNITVAGDSVYFIAQSAWDEDAPSFYFFDVYAMSIDGSDLRKLPNYNVNVEIPAEAEDGGVQILAMTIDNSGNIWIVERGDFFYMPDGYDDDHWERWNARTIVLDFIRLRKLDNTGVEIISFDIGYMSTGQDWFHIYAFTVDADNNIYIGVESTIHVLDSEGRVLFTLDVQWVEGFVNMQDGSVAHSGWGAVGKELSLINVAGKSMDETITLPNNAHNVYSGNEEYSFIFTDGIGLHGIEAESGEVTLLLNWIDSDMTVDGLDNITFLSDGRILVTSQHWNSEGATHEIIFLTKTPYSELPERITLTLATFHLDWDIRSAVVQFNRTSDTHRIMVTDYAAFNSSDDWQAGLTRLSAEIIAGNVPDILDVSNLPFNQYVAKDLLIDLYPLIDSDPDISRGDFMENILRASEIGGGIFKVFPTFSITTMLGNPSVVGSYPGWNMEEFIAVLAANPDADYPLGQGLTKMNLLQALFMFNMDDYVDWNEGTVHFDSNEFTALLEYANTLPDEYDWSNDYLSEIELISAGRQIIAATAFHYIDDYQMYRAVFGGEIVYKGLPAENRNGYSLNIRTGFSITNKCKDIEGAWGFLRTFLLEDWQTNRSWHGMPLNKNVFDKILSEAMIESEYGPRTMGWNDFTVVLEPLTQADVDKITALVDSVSGFVGQDDVLWNIISESASGFFGGQTTVQDAVRVIQNRASIYVSEQS
jgi:ABC-type glycerol-3-phosphate transport system substrate-binding protein